MPLYPSRNPNYINLKDYCKIDGVSDDSVGFTTAYTLASSLGMGLLHPGGTLIKGNDTLLSRVAIIGAGPGISTFKLKNGANTDLFSAFVSNINLSGAVFSGSATGVVQVGLYNLTLDGNKANQTSGTSYPLRFYGYSCTLQNIEVKNGYTGGILTDWNNTADPSGISIINHWKDVEVHDCTGIGIQVGGPTDCQWTSVNSYKNTSHSYHFAPNAVGYVLTTCHGWEQTHGVNAVCVLCEAGGNKFVNCQFEGSDVCEVVFVGNDNEIHGGEVFAGFNGNSSTGIQLGQTAGNTPYPGQIYQSGGVTTSQLIAGTLLNTKIDNCVGAAIDYQNEHNSDVTVLIWANGGNILKSGRLPYYLDRISHSVNGVTSDGTTNTCPRFQFSGPGNNMFAVLGNDGTPILNANGTSNILSIANSTVVQGYSDYYSTLTFKLDASTGNIYGTGAFASGQSAAANDPGNNGAIGVSNVGMARVNPAASRTGCTMQSGTQAGQRVVVVNENATNSITFATEATSHIAGSTGSNIVIGPKGKLTLDWDSSTSLWY